VKQKEIGENLQEEMEISEVSEVSVSPPIQKKSAKKQKVK
jgi:hypothetical protein